VSLIVSCDSRNGNGITDPTTQPPPPPVGTDNTAPVVDVSLATGTTAADTIVYIGGNMNVSIVASDNLGLATISTTMRTATGSSIVDSATFNPTVGNVARSYAIDPATVARGDRLVFTTRATDASSNPKLDSVKVVVADTATPVVTVASKSSAIVKGLDSIDVVVTATDVAGIDSAGFRLLRVRAVGDTVVVFTRTAKPAARTTSFTIPDNGFRISDTLPIGQYLLMPFAADKSGLTARNVVPFAFTLTDATRPQVTIIEPVTGQRVGVGNTIRVKARLTDNAGVANVTFLAYSQRGDSLLGTNHTDQRYATVTAPSSGSFPQTRDTTITRDLQAITPVDSLTDTLWVSATVTDVSGLTTTVRVAVQMTNGPRVTLLQPVAGDSLVKGDTLTITVAAVSSSGVQAIGFALSDSGFPTSVAQVADAAISPPSAAGVQVTSTRKILIPSNAAGVLTITPHATDINGQQGFGTPFRIAVRQGAGPAPLVRQTIAARVEVLDSVNVSATGTALRKVGYSIHELLTNALVDSGAVTASSTSFGPTNIAIHIPVSFQGQRVSIVSYATDSIGRTGYSVPSTTSTPITDPTLARRDTSLVVFGSTFALPTTRTGTIADVLVDTINGNVFLSNIGAGRVEVFNQATGTFSSTGIVVGSQPWGMTMSRTAPAHDTLYVANSGGTNLSRVFVGGSNPALMKEDLTNRLKTRVSLAYTISEVTDTLTGKIRITVSAPATFSDRPQYVEQSSGGRLYISTKPTSAAPAGTVRWINPAAPAPDERFVLAFAGKGNDPNSTLIVNLDDAAVRPSAASSTASDTLILCDHPSGSLAPATCVSSAGGVGATLLALRAAVPTTDVESGGNLDVNTLGLSDTTFVATSGDGNWIGFGEGNKAPFARSMLIKDANPADAQYTYATPSFFMQDLINNAADRVFGLALDKTGQTLAVHGAETYFAFVDQPFTERLQGKRTTIAQGAGVAFHPGADGINTPSDQRLAFVASTNGTIEILDIAHYDFNRGTIVTKNSFYGPIRAVTPTLTEQASGIKVKLYGMTTAGLVIINVTAADILPAP
jgi:hypothetical protein